MIHHLDTTGIGKGILAALRALALLILVAAVSAGTVLLVLAWWDAGMMANRAEIAGLRARVAYLEGAARPLVQVEDGGRVNIIPAGMGE